MATNPNAFSPLQLARQATTGLPGFALANATPSVLAYTTPNDGQMHRVIPWGEVAVTSAETGGQLSLLFTDPGGNARNVVLDAGGHGAAGIFMLNNFSFLVAPNTAVTLQQTTALTAGAAAIYAELWGI